MSNLDASQSKLLGSIGEINDIQQEIEAYTKKIEHEKINLRLVKERHQKQKNLLTSLENSRKPTISWNNPTKNHYQAKKVLVEGYEKKENGFSLQIQANKTELSTVKLKSLK